MESKAEAVLPYLLLFFPSCRSLCSDCVNGPTSFWWTIRTILSLYVVSIRTKYLKWWGQNTVRIISLKPFCLIFICLQIPSYCILCEPTSLCLISTDVVCSPVCVSEQRWKIRSSWSTTCWIRLMRWLLVAAWPSPSSKSSTTWRWGRWLVSKY